MKNLKLKGLKYNKGKYHLYDQRYLFFPPQIIDILASIYGEGVKSLLVWLGKKAGWDFAQNWEENLNPSSLDYFIDKFCEKLNSQGWGEFIPKKISDEEIIIELHDNISSSLENSKYYCYFISGVLSGLGEFVLYKVDVEETKCSIGDEDSEFCEFRLLKIS